MDKVQIIGIFIGAAILIIAYFCGKDMKKNAKNDKTSTFSGWSFSLNLLSLVFIQKNLTLCSSLPQDLLFFHISWTIHIAQTKESPKKHFLGQTQGLLY